MEFWETRGFEAFRRGTFGNGGQNLYVSRAGVLQRIYQFDLTGNGFVDLAFCNSQSHWEKPDSLVYSDVLGDVQCCGIRSHGCRAATVADLNGDGYADLVLGCFKDGIATDLNAMIYYGSPEGLTENYHIELPAPKCTAVAAGDFNGDGKIDLAFITAGRVRIFYQTNLGFELKRFTDLAIEGQQLDAFDLDGDGCAELIVRAADGSVTVYRGGKDGIDESAKSKVDLPEEEIRDDSTPEDEGASAEEFVADADPLVRVVLLDGTPHLFCPQRSRAFLAPVTGDCEFVAALEFAVTDAYAVAAGDVNGNGIDDLVFAARSEAGGEECSWIYWGSADGFAEERRDALPSERAADVALGDLDGSGFSDILLTQNRSLESFTTESLVYRGCAKGVEAEPVRLVSHDARRGFIARTSDAPLPQVILTSNFARSASDDLSNSIYFGSKEGYSKDNRLEVEGWGSISSVMADLNDNGRVDLVYANGAEFSAVRDRGSYIYYGSEDGIGSVPNEVLPTRAATVVVCADLNRNGWLDLVFCGFRHPEVLIFPGGPEGFDAEKKIIISLELEGRPYGFLFSLFLVDLNGNGWLDMVVGGGAEERALILWGGPAGYSCDRSQALAAYIPRLITAADLTGNGYPDLIIGARKPQLSGPHDAFMYIYWNGPDGLREDRRAMLPVKSTNGLAVGDFNNNGMLDIFTGSYSDGRERDLESYIYWNRRGSGFTLLDRLCMQTHAVGGCLVADLNENGWLDLVVTNHKVLGDHKGESEIWWNGPEGFNVERTTALPTVGARGPSVIHPGNLLDRGPEEYYVSEPHALSGRAVARGLSWEADTPLKTWVKGQVRVADTADELELCSWMGPDGEGTWWKDNGASADVSLEGAWVQFRLALGATNSCSTPRVSAARVHYEID